MGPAAADAPASRGKRVRRAAGTGASTKLALAKRLEGGRTGCLGLNCLIGIVTKA